jgi:hypothetical protein
VSSLRHPHTEQYPNTLRNVKREFAPIAKSRLVPDARGAPKRPLGSRDPLALGAQLARYRGDRESPGTAPAAALGECPEAGALAHENDAERAA